MKIKYIFWDDDTGYGISAKQLIRSLLNLGIQVFPVNLKIKSKYKGEYVIPDTASRQEPYDLVLIHTSPYYTARFIEPGKVNIAYCTWETTVMPGQWVEQLNKCDLIFVPSYFNQVCFQKSGITKPIKILPHISEFLGASENAVLDRQKTTGFTFYSIGMWTNRKNNWALIQAFSNAFTHNEPVELLIKTSKKDYTRPAFDLFRKFGFAYYNNLMNNQHIKDCLQKDSRIKIITDHWSYQQIKDLHVQGDCYVSLTKSEGWGLGAYEAAWFGKPVIITGFGGQLDYLNEDLATLLPYDLIKIKDPVWSEYNSQQQEWAQVDMTAASQAMRAVFQSKNKYKMQGQALQQFVKLKFNEQEIIKSFQQDIHTYFGIR